MGLAWVVHPVWATRRTSLDVPAGIWFRIVLMINQVMTPAEASWGRFMIVYVKISLEYCSGSCVSSFSFTQRQKALSETGKMECSPKVLHISQSCRQRTYWCFLRSFDRLLYWFGLGFKIQSSIPMFVSSLKEGTKLGFLSKIPL